MSGAVEGVDVGDGMIEFAARVLWADGQRRLKQGQSDLPRTRTDFRAAAAALFDHPALASLTTPPARSYADGVEDAAKVAEAYTEVNFEAAGDSVLLDPVLRGKGFSAKNMAESERQQIAGLVHSSQAHAGKHLAAAIRLLSQGGKA